MAISPRLQVKSLSVQRSGQPVLRQLDLCVMPGQAVSISGPSGCGKSTLLRALALLEAFNQGTIWLDGVDASTLPYTVYRRRVSLVFQEPPMFSGTVASNVRFGPALFGRHLSEGELVELLRKVSLPAEMLAREARDLSGGERQRVALARALANDPDVLLLDEPTSALDPEAAHGVLREVRALTESGLAVVAVMHVPEHARMLGHVQLHMQAGQLVQEVAQ